MTNVNMIHSIIKGRGENIVMPSISILIYKRTGGGGDICMKKTILAVFITFLMLLTVFGVCFTASADGFINLWGKVTVNGSKISGTRIEALTDQGEKRTNSGTFGYYFIRGLEQGKTHTVVLRAPEIIDLETGQSWRRTFSGTDLGSPIPIIGYRANVVAVSDDHPVSRDYGKFPLLSFLLSLLQF
ncbi:MAG: hypothetical protein JSW62_03145 [Thermoplasmatales archaeon]|nr:MAG: hypothetical protein JSW62_03145 [Thermoplasmatales archaeon]